MRGEERSWTRETWIGEPYLGHMTGFPSIDVRSVGAGGGSIAWVTRAASSASGRRERGRRSRAGLLRQGGERARP
ncbi:MAG: hypothetical protein R3C15_12690 [Thermoleophilia bacterium]